MLSLVTYNQMLIFLLGTRCLPIFNLINEGSPNYLIKNYLYLYYATPSNLKKVVTISLAIFYLFVASGVFLNLHFCGDHVKKFAFYMVNDEEGCCGSEEVMVG